VPHATPAATRTLGSRLARAPWYAAFALLLAACGSPGVSPGLQVSLGSASMAIVRGATAEVQVSLTRLGGATDPVDLSVSGLPASVTATFSPATLDGATLTSTLTVSVAAAASGAITDLTVTATSGSLSDDVVLSLEVTSLTVVGRVQATLARPLTGATVASQGETVFTDATGTFTLTGLSVPYDVTVSSAGGNGGLHVYEGMISPSPTLRPTFASLDTPTPGFDAVINGSLLGGAVGVDEVVIVCVEGLVVAVYGCDTLVAAETDFSISAAWFDGAIAATRLHALHIEIDADSLPVAYLGYETIELNLSDGSVTLADLDFDPVDAASLTGTTAHPMSMPDSVLLVSPRFGPNLSVPIIQLDDPGADFEVLVPDLPGLGYDVLFVASGVDDTVYTWKHDVGLDAGDLVVTAPAQLVAPANGAPGVDLATSFGTTEAGGGARTYVWAPDGTGPFIGLTTTRTNVTIPDPGSGGFAFPAGLAYEWGVVGHGDGDVDVAASGGFADFTVLSIIFSGNAGPGPDGDRTFSFPSEVRDFTFAP